MIEAEIAIREPVKVPIISGVRFLDKGFDNPLKCGPFPEFHEAHRSDGGHTSRVGLRLGRGVGVLEHANVQALQLRVGV